MQSLDGYLATHEAFHYVFDFCLIYLCCLILTIWHFGEQPRCLPPPAWPAVMHLAVALAKLGTAVPERTLLHHAYAPNLRLLPADQQEPAHLPRALQHRLQRGAARSAVPQGTHTAHRRARQVALCHTFAARAQFFPERQPGPVHAAEPCSMSFCSSGLPTTPVSNRAVTCSHGGVGSFIASLFLCIACHPDAVYTLSSLPTCYSYPLALCTQVGQSAQAQAPSSPQRSLSCSGGGHLAQLGN